MTDDLIERLRIAAHSLREEGFPPAPLLLENAAVALRTASERIVELEKEREEGNSSSVDSRAPGYMARSDTSSSARVRDLLDFLDGFNDMPSGKWRDRWPEQAKLLTDATDRGGSIDATYRAIRNLLRAALADDAAVLGEAVTRRSAPDEPLK